MKHSSLERTNANLKQIRAPIALLGEKEIFGQEEILSNEKRKTQAKCIGSMCEVFLIKKEVKKTFKKIIKKLLK
jgi:CRP-like cAMP-binding protein